MRNPLRSAAAIAGVLLVSASGPAFAADGQIAINMARAMAGIVTPGDAPGFPVTISQPGSYILTGNLTVPDADTTAILIAASHVTIDLNGFAILGPVDCSGGLLPCAGAPSGGGTGSGIATTVGFSHPSQFNITIRNGTIQGMGRLGVLLDGDSNVIERVHVRSNALGGILLNDSGDSGFSMIERCTAERNGGIGIHLVRGIARDNIADINVWGLTVNIGAASNNLAARNLQTGMDLGTAVNAHGNTMLDNPQGNLLGGSNQGQNVCSGGGGGC